MEGLKGTAIRSAVRDPGCPQAPVLAQDSAAPGAGEGFLLQVAQVTTTVPAIARACRRFRPACRLRSGDIRRADAGTGLPGGVMPRGDGTVPGTERVWRAGPAVSRWGSQRPWLSLAVTFSHAH
jgi:hypothetical protein